MWPGTNLWAKLPLILDGSTGKGSSPFSTIALINCANYSDLVKFINGFNALLPWREYHLPHRIIVSIQISQCVWSASHSTTQCWNSKLAVNVQQEKKKSQSSGSNITFYLAAHQRTKIICDNAGSQKLPPIRQLQFFFFEATYGSSSTGVSWMNVGLCRLCQAHAAKLNHWHLKQS